MDVRRRQLALIAAILGSSVVGLDATVVSVALPAIERELGGGMVGQQWVANSYLLTLGALILIGGSLGDIYGERRVFSLGVAGFGLVSAICAAAPSIEVLIVGRALQGAFGALLTPSALAVIIAAFPAPERGGAIGSWTAWQGIATVIGPLLGGWLIDVASWRWIFAINVPLVLLTLGVVAAGIPARERGAVHAPVDWPGAALTAVGLAGPVLALVRQPEVGWESIEVWGSGLGGLALLGLFLLRESRTRYPMMPLGLFSRRNFAVGNLQTLAMYAGLSITFFLLVLFLQQVAGYNALEAGLATLPTTVVMFALSRRAGALADRYGPRRFMGIGPLLAAAGLAWMALMDADVDYVSDLLPGLLLFSLGLAATVAPLTATVLADADEHNAGIASGINNAVARVAGLLGVAALSAVVISTFGAALDERVSRADQLTAAPALEAARERGLARLGADQPPALRAAVADASVEAFRFGMGISAALVGLGGLLALAGIRDPRRTVSCADCAGGQLAGAPLEAAESGGWSPLRAGDARPDGGAPARDREQIAVAAAGATPGDGHRQDGARPDRADRRGAAGAPADGVSGAGAPGDGARVRAGCGHLDHVRVSELPGETDGCAECLRTGGRWVHLRICLECGQVGCCDSSPGRHARAHARSEGHPIARSIEPGEDWSWCYEDSVAMRLPQVRGSTRIPPAPPLRAR